MINGDRVKQARELRGFTQTALAKRIRVNQSAIAQIETSRTIPSDEVLQGIVLQTGFPVGFFKQQTSTDFPLGSLLFRARASMTYRQRCEAHQYARTVFEFTEKLEQHVSKIPLRLPRLNEDPISAAKHTRSALGLSPDTPIPNLINALEKNGVLVLALPTILKNRDAFCVWAGNNAPRPAIILSGGGPGDRLRFSVAHELGHLVMHQAIIGDISDIEDEANQFAGEFLMPEHAIRQEIVAPVTLLALAKLKPRWKVSIQALMRRAYDLTIITQRQYKYLMQQLSARGWRIKEPGNLDIPVEKPRALSKMAELIYGHPVNYKKMASDLNLPIQLVRETLEAHASRGHFGQVGGAERSPSIVLDFTRRNSQAR